MLILLHPAVVSSVAAGVTFFAPLAEVFDKLPAERLRAPEFAPVLLEELQEAFDA